MKRKLTALLMVLAMVLTFACGASGETAVDVEQELREMRAWCQANPKLRKTKNGVRRFIVSWLARQQDKGHPGMAVKPKPERRFVPTEL